MAVDLEIISRIQEVKGWFRFIVRNNKYTPAVTKVDEWTKAEIGVGAAIAIGNHAENGNCALFDKAAVNIIININVVNSIFILKFQLDERVIILIDKRIKMSPIRFLSNVIVPEAADGKFW